MRVSWMFASAELVTIRQLMMPSEMASAIACRSRLCTIIGRASVNSVLSPVPVTSASAASCSAAGGAGTRRSASPAQRLIARSSWEAEFCKVVLVEVCVSGDGAREWQSTAVARHGTLMEKSSMELPPAAREPAARGALEVVPSSAAMRACSRAICRSCSSSCVRCSSTF